MELAHLRALRAVAEELHFGRAAARLRVSPARVTQLVQQLEIEIGGPLFTRTTRRVALTQLGEQVHHRICPIYDDLVATIDDAKASARSVLRVGFTVTTGVPALDAVVTVSAARLGVAVQLRELSPFDPYGPLRAGEVDVLLNWLIEVGDDLDAGIEVGREPRAVLMAADHPLATRSHVTTDDLADYCVPAFESGDVTRDRALHGIVPLTSTTGRTIPRHPERVRGLAEASRMVARGEALWPTIRSFPVTARDTLTLRPLTDLLDLPLGLLWRRDGSRNRWLNIESVFAEQFAAQHETDDLPHRGVSTSAAPE